MGDAPNRDKSQEQREKCPGCQGCGELTYGRGVGYELDVCLGAGQKSLEKSDQRQGRG